MSNIHYEMTTQEAFNICLEISSQIIDLTASNAKVYAKYSQYKMIKSELEYLSAHYHESTLNGLLKNILNSFEILEKEILTNKSQYEDLYGKNSGDGYV